MNSDPEIDAMRTINETLSGLDQDSVVRILKWARDRYGSIGVLDQNANEVSEYTSQEDEMPSIGEFFSRISPETESDKVLVMAFALRLLAGQEEVAAQQVNKELTHLGYHISNITRAFDKLRATKPQLIIQTRKSGTTQQARKAYKLTEAGIQKVRSMQSNP
jgi:hypothetical protein